MITRAQLWERAAKAVKPYLWDGHLEGALGKITRLFTSEQAAESVRQKQAEVKLDMAITTPAIVKPVLDELRPLISNWQANGNSRALDDPKSEVWHRAARELLERLDELEITFTTAITEYEKDHLND